MKNLRRTDIINGNYEFPEHFVRLNYTNHFRHQLTKRSIGFSCIPTIIRVTKDNIQSAKSKDGVKLCSVVVRLPYSKYQNLFICFNPYDGAAKTIWFRDVTKRKTNRKNSEQTVRDGRIHTNIQTNT